MTRPMTPYQAEDAYSKKEAARVRRAMRIAKGLPPEPERLAGAAERKYQEELEARGQLTLFGAAR